MPCYCPLCTTEPRPTYTEAWRHACEVRDVESMTQAQRSRYLDLVHSQRSPEAMARIMADMKPTTPTPPEEPEDLFNWHGAS